MTSVGTHLKKIVNKPENWDFSGARSLYAGVDIGTYKAIVIVVDETGYPRAARMNRTEVVRSGLIVDYAGAVATVKEMIESIRARSPMPIEKGATSYPPRTEDANIHATRYILETLEIEVMQVLDEPTAANQVLSLENGAIVDVGGGTTGIAVIQDGDIVYTNDEATGGVHLTLTLAGHYKIDYEAAEKIKVNRKKHQEIIAIVRPVVEKIASIAAGYLEKFDRLDKIYLVGGTTELKGFKKIYSQMTGHETFRPPSPQFTTPLGIALSCLGGNQADRTYVEDVAV
ncbi:MAG: ethanolamine utilization protein EutJ [Deltaproteobacteria bacterium]|nr:MAG: ethanolamine utilization protein EutJ [Deltaproteobacteria bacterium]